MELNVGVLLINETAGSNTLQTSSRLPPEKGCRALEFWIAIGFWVGFRGDLFWVLSGLGCRVDILMHSNM